MQQDDQIYNPQFEEIINNCLDLQFEYFDLNAGISYQPLNIVKAWKITPHNKDYPILIVNDNSSEIIGYNNGLVENL